MDILIIIKDFDTRTIFTALLRSLGYRVHELEEVDDVVSAASGCALVITEYPTMMPGGRTITETLRQDVRTRDIKILNTTTRAYSGDLERALLAGVDATLVLPAYPARVAEVVHQLISAGVTRSVRQALPG